jgi:acyl carrier protein
LEQSYVAPCNPLEEILAGIWSEVLGIGQIGVHDNFSELGGDSLSATRIVSRIRRDLRMESSLRSFLETTTVAQLAALLDHEKQGGETP